MTNRWHLVVTLCFFMPGAGAIATAKAEGAGFGASVIILVLGLTLGFVCAWMLHLAGVAAGNQMRQQTGARQARIAMVLNVGAVLWMVIALVLGLWLSSVASRHLL